MLKHTDTDKITYDQLKEKKEILMQIYTYFVCF